MFNKPIERMMIRYDRQPSDFSNLLEPAFDSLNDKNGQKLTRRIVNNFGGIVFERPSSGTYLTLSRYFEFRYIFIIKPVQCNITFVILTCFHFAIVFFWIRKIQRAAFQKNVVDEKKLFQSGKFSSPTFFSEGSELSFSSSKRFVK